MGRRGDMDDRHNSRLKEVDHHHLTPARTYAFQVVLWTVGLYRLERSTNFICGES